MSIWFRIPANRETAFKGAYLGERVRGRDNPNEDETANFTIEKDAAGNPTGFLFTGSSRIADAVADRLSNNNPPWIEIFDHWPPAA